MSLPVPPKVRMRVIAHRDSCAHTCNGSIESLSEYAPVAVVAFDCGCRAYVPLRRLDPEPSGDGRCMTPGCRRAEWPVGTGTCMKHKNAAATGAASPAPVNTPGVGQEQPFDSQARPCVTGTSAPQPRGGRAAIDGRGTKGRTAPSKPGEQAAREGQHAAGRIAGGGRASTPGALAAAGAVAQGEPPVALPAQSASASAGGRPPVWSTESCLQAARDWRDVHGRWPRSRDWFTAKGPHPASSTVKRLFGGWVEFMAQLGVEHPHRRGWTRRKAITAARRYARENGRGPGAEAFNVSGRPAYAPSYSTVIKLFGSWSAYLEAAELPPNPIGRPKLQRAA